MNVLLVTTDTPLIERTRMMLGLLGTHPTVLDSTDEALEVCRQEPFPLILLDPSSDGASGPAFCRYLRELPHGSSSVLVAIADGDKTPALEELLENGADDFILRGDSPELFGIRLGGLFQQARGRTEKVSTEGALKESEHRLNALFDTAAEGIIIIDTHGVVESFSKAAENIFGYSAAEMVGKNLNVLMPPEEGESHDQHISRYLRTGEAGVIGEGREVTGQHKDGLKLPLFLRVGEFKDEDGTRFIGCVENLFNRKVAETQVQKGHDDLLAVLSGLNVGTAIIGTDGQMVYLNDLAQRICGKRPVDAVDKPWQECLPFEERELALISDMAIRPERDRTRLSLHSAIPGKQEYRLDIEILNDPIEKGRTILFMYDMTEVHSLRTMLDEKSTFHDMVGKSRQIKLVFQQIREISHVDWSVLIEGETGTGKEMVARALHAQSPRRDDPFISVSATGLEDDALSALLYGYQAGAFDDSQMDRKGLFERANGGTLFIEEIADVPLSVQSSLLKTLEYSEVNIMGDDAPRAPKKVDVRVIAATQKDLTAEVEAGRFRADLLYRIRVARIVLPPLRERKDDLPLLIGSALTRCRAATGKVVETVSNNAMRRLTRHAWPGNVRELIHAIEFGALRARGPVIHTRDLPYELGSPGQLAPGLDGEVDEKTRLMTALAQTGGNRARAARMLGVSRATLYRRLEACNLPTRKHI